MERGTYRAAGAIALVMLAVSPAMAVIVPDYTDSQGIVHNTGRNLNTPPDDLLKYEGVFGSFLGTPIAPRYFVTANHIGNQLSLSYANGTNTVTRYTTTFVAAKDDLAIFKIADSDPSFTLWAPLYTGSNELGNSLVVIGNGTARGPAITNGSGSLVGWQWGAFDGLRSWGTGVVSDIATVVNKDGTANDYLQFPFAGTPTAQNTDPGILSYGDSGGAAFIEDPADGVWKLAGINSGVDLYSQTSNGPLVQAAFLDAQGYYDGTDLITAPLAGSSYETRISSRVGFIAANTPEPGAIAVVLMAAPVLLRRRRRQRGHAGSAGGASFG